MARTESQLGALGQMADASTGAVVELTKVAAPYTTIVNRAQMVDLSKDLMPRMGIDRVCIQDIYRIDGESGSNGELVWGAVNDSMGAVRFAGSSWRSLVDGQGVSIGSSSTSDFIEITFYGNGLNILYAYSDGTERGFNAAVDGAGSTLISSITSAIIGSRQYSTNLVKNVTSGLALGLHTVKLTRSSSSTCYFAGYEALNTASTIQLTPGSIYSKGRKLAQATLGSTSYNSGFESGTLGARGGRVSVYKKSDGTTAKAVNPVGSQLNLTAADHTNEEVIRSYYWREFGAGRSDDFSLLVAAASAVDRAFTLDDGTTTLVGNQVNNSPVSEGLSANQASGAFITLTFVGSGLDIVISSDGNTRQFDAVSIDGAASVGAISYAASTAFKIAKVVSGLPYGTHTIKFSQTSANFSPSINKFIVYGPKKPILPTGAVEIADYNIMADYSAASSSTLGFISSGVLRKMNARENTYSGTFTAFTLDTTYNSGWKTGSSTTTSYGELTFVGTGIEYHGFLQNAEVLNYSMTVDGSALNAGTNTGSTVTSQINGSTGVSVSAAGVVTGTVSGNGSLFVRISGLTFGKHTVRITCNAGTGTEFFDCFDIITPIHVHKNNESFAIENTLSIGSQGINDSRKFGNQVVATVNSAKAVGMTANPTTASSSYIPIPDIITTSKSNTGMVRVEFPFTWHSTIPDSTSFFALYVDGVAVDYEEQASASTSSTTAGINTLQWIVPVSPGIHTYVVQWRTNGAGTMTAIGAKRRLMVMDLPKA